MEEYKQKSLDFANNIEKWYEGIESKKKEKIENDDEFVYLESSPSRFTQVFEENKESKTVYEDMNYLNTSDNSFTSESEDESNHNGKIIHLKKVQQFVEREEPLKPKSKENTQSLEKLHKKRKRKIIQALDKQTC